MAAGRARHAEPGRGLPGLRPRSRPGDGRCTRLGRGGCAGLGRDLDVQTRDFETRGNALADVLGGADLLESADDDLGDLFCEGVHIVDLQACLAYSRHQPLLTRREPHDGVAQKDREGDTEDRVEDLTLSQGGGLLVRIFAPANSRINVRKVSR